MSMFTGLIDIKHIQSVIILKITNMLVIWKFTNREVTRGCMSQHLRTLEL